MEELETASGDEQAAPAIEPGAEPVDETVNDNVAIDEQLTETEPEPEDPDLEDIEWNGKSFKAPKGLKDGVLMHADYTKKTQEVAATRKELEQRAAALDQQYQAADEELDLRASLKAIDAELQQYANVDWQKLENEDLVGAQSHWRRFSQLKEAAQGTRAELESKVTARSGAAQQETAKRLHETREFAEKKIPGWTPEVDAKVTEFAIGELGLSKDMLLGAYTPQIYRALHLAWLGNQTMNKPASKPAATTPAIKPTETVAARSNPGAAKSLAAMDMDEYVAQRQKQMAARGR